MEQTRDKASDAPEFNQDSVQAPERVEGDPAPQVWHPQQHQRQHFGPDSLNNPQGYPQSYSLNYGQQNQPQNIKSQAEESHATEKRDNSRRLAGLPVWAFWLLLVVFGLVIVGSSIGGAIGGTSASKSHASGKASTM